MDRTKSSVQDEKILVNDLSANWNEIKLMCHSEEWWKIKMGSKAITFVIIVDFYFGFASVVRCALNNKEISC